MAKAVILNDTRGDNHFGCHRVMRVIESHLARRGIEVIGRSLVRNDWQKDAAFLHQMQRADLIVINGEGTLHHGSRHGERLLSCVDHPACASKPVVLINTLYQDNPAEWGRYLKKMALIAARDPWSAEQAAKQAGRPVRHLPDLSLAERDDEPPPGPRSGPILFGDSVIRSTSAALLAEADRRPNGRFLPILTTIKPSKPHYPWPLRQLRDAYIHLHAIWFRLRHPHVRYCRNEQQFIDQLKVASLHVTGRFHAICLCLVTRTPFVALESNSWKIRALLTEFGLGLDRLVPRDQLAARIDDPSSLDFTAAELAAIAERLDWTAREANRLFDDIAALVGQG